MANERENITKTEEMTAEPRRNGRWIDRCFFFNSETLGGLILRCAILLAIPWAYVWLCGLVLNYWLKLYNMTPFIFYSWIVLLILALAAIGYAIVRFRKNRRS